MNTERLTLSVSEAANILGISAASAYTWAHRGVIPCIKIGRSLRVPKSGLMRMIEQEQSHAAIQIQEVEPITAVRLLS